MPVGVALLLLDARFEAGWTEGARKSPASARDQAAMGGGGVCENLGPLLGKASTIILSSRAGSASAALSGRMATSKSMHSSQSRDNFLPDFRICRFIALPRCAPNRSARLRSYRQSPRTGLGD